jgi:hypothetical protein
MAGDTKLPKMASGQRYGRLTALEFYGRERHGWAIWSFRCDCGVEFTALAANARFGTTKSCGCARTKHGMAGTQEYHSWIGMLSRCRDQNNSGYKDYGGRGISVCAKWTKFENFLADMGLKPSASHSIDRINNNGNYEPGNCKWSTPKEQAANQRPKTLDRRLSVKSTSGFTGVRQNHEGRWQVRVMTNGARRHLGCFDRIEDAVAAREKFKASLSASPQE